MKRLKHYFPNYILSIIIVFLIIALSAVSFASKNLLSSSYYISSVEKNEIYQKVSDYAEDYFAKSYAVSSIPAEIYMDGLDEKIIKQAIDNKIINFFDYLNNKTDSVKETEIDFSKLEENINNYFNEFAQENNVELNDAFNQQLDKTITAAETDIETFSNVFMLDFIEKTNAPQTIRKAQPILSTIIYAIGGMLVVCLIIMIVLNKKQIKSVLYWLATAGICASVITIVPCIIVKSTNFFSKLVMRTDYIYAAITGVLNDTVNSFMKMQFIIFGISLAIMIVYIICSLLSKKEEAE